MGFHDGSHHAKDPGRVARYAILNQYHVSMVAYFADKLNSIEAGEGTLLDNSLTKYGSNMGNSNQHLHYDVLMSILDLMGVPHDSYGDSTGELPGLI